MLCGGIIFASAASFCLGGYRRKVPPWDEILTQFPTTIILAHRAFNGWELYAYLRYLFERLPNAVPEDL